MTRRFGLSSGRGHDHLMGILRERVSTFVGLLSPRQDAKPKIGPFLIAGVIWGAVMGVVTQWLFGHGFWGWYSVNWLIFGTVVMGRFRYWLVSSKWRSREAEPRGAPSP
jgi:hypothetical protein